MKILNLKAYNEYGLDRIALTWSTFPEEEPQAGFRYRVWRAPQPEGPWTLLHELAGLRVYLDYLVDLYTPGATYVYRVDCRAPEDDDWQPSAYAVYRSDDPDVYTDEIIRRHHMLLEHSRAPECSIFTRRLYGTRCQCWNALRKESNGSRCPICYGTGWVGGYFGPYRERVSFSMSRAQRRMLSRASDGVADGTTECWTVNYPALTPGDLIVTPFNDRYRVLQTQVSRRGLVVLHQVMAVARLAVTDAAYGLSPDGVPAG